MLPLHAWRQGTSIEASGLFGILQRGAQLVGLAAHGAVQRRRERLRRHARFSRH